MTPGSGRVATDCFCEFPSVAYGTRSCVRAFAGIEMYASDTANCCCRLLLPYLCILLAPPGLLTVQKCAHKEWAMKMGEGRSIITNEVRAKINTQISRRQWTETVPQKHLINLRR